MAISITRYVNIISSVGAGATVPRRNLIGRIFTQNQYVPTNSFITFTSAAEVGAWFGTNSAEYARAVYYFGWVSKNGNIPPSIDYARYTLGNTYPQIFGNIQPQSVGMYNTISNGSFILTFGSTTVTYSGIDLTSAVSLTDVAAIIQTTIQGSSGTVFTGATVVYDPVRGSFNLQGGDNSVPYIVSVQPGTSGTPLGNLLGWVSGPTLIVSDGIGAQAPQIFGNIQSQAPSDYTGITEGSFTLTIGTFSHTFSGLDFSADTTLAEVATTLQTAVQAVTAGGTMWTSATVIYNATVGNFQFLGGDEIDSPISVQEGISGQPIGNLLGWVSGPTLQWISGLASPTPVDAVINSAQASNNFGSFLFVESLLTSDIISIAQWNATQNVSFIYCVPALNQSLAVAYNQALIGFGGTQITLAPLSTEYPEQFPMMILAATDYDASNSVQNYMFQQSALTPSVSDDTTASYYDTLLVNYYGATQTAGTLLAFYQRGVMMGPSSLPRFLNVFANEIWFRDAMQSSLMNLLLTQNRIPANSAGQSQSLAVIQSVIDEATNNGTISANKTLTPTQIAFITSTTGDSNAWYQVQTIGYWVNCQILSYINPNNGLTEYELNYTVIYSKDDVINLITGQQILI